MNNRHLELEQMLISQRNESIKEKLMDYFKTGKGQYGEGDMFLGIKVPDVRSTIRPYQYELTIEETSYLVKSKYHEIRMAGLLIWVNQFKKMKQESDRKAIVEAYLSHTPYINNWDLVDLSCTYIIGPYLSDKERDILFTLAKSSNLWEQRIAIVSTLWFIRKGDFEDAFKLCEGYLDHKHDLIHKACGWCLREIGKKNENLLKSFLDIHAESMPRTMLRYCIEKFSETDKQFYMSRRKLAR